jgi:hypothetical protein
MAFKTMRRRLPVILSACQISEQAVSVYVNLQHCYVGSRGDLSNQMTI